MNVAYSVDNAEESSIQLTVQTNSVSNQLYPTPSCSGVDGVYTLHVSGDSAHQFVTSSSTPPGAGDHAVEYNLLYGDGSTVLPTTKTSFKLEQSGLRLEPTNFKLQPFSLEPPGTEPPSSPLKDAETDSMLLRLPPTTEAGELVSTTDHLVDATSIGPVILSGLDTESTLASLSNNKENAPDLFPYQAWLTKKFFLHFLVV